MRVTALSLDGISIGVTGVREKIPEQSHVKGWADEDGPVKEPEQGQPVRQKENQESGLFWNQGPAIRQILLVGQEGVQVSISNSETSRLTWCSSLWLKLRPYSWKLLLGLASSSM